MDFANLLQVFFALAQIALAFIVAVATVVYAWFTYILVKETRRLREVQTEPDIVVYLQPSDVYSLFDIVVKNVGPGAAYNLIWSFDRNASLITNRNTGLDKIRFFEQVAYFAPGQVFKHFVGAGPELLQNPVPPALVLGLSYIDCVGKQHRREYIIDVMQFHNRMRVDADPTVEAAKSLKKVEEHLKNLISGRKRIDVNIFDGPEREE